MKLIEVFIIIMFYMTAVSGRKLHDSNFEDEENYMDLEKPIRGHSSKHTRPSREYRNLYYNHYDPYDFGEKDFNKDSYSLKDELLSDIFQKLDELNSYLKRSQPTTSQVQIKCVPVYYPVSQTPNKKDGIPNISITQRWRGIDKRQIWGVAPSKPVQRSDDGSRPINLDPVEPNEPTVRPPPVEHGSTQAGMTSQAPRAKGPGPCKAAILVCCQRKTNRERQQCFSKYGCTKTYSTNRVCHPKIIKLVTEEFINSYAPL